MTNLQPALHRAHVTLNKCNPQAVVLDRDGVAWQKWYRRWWAAGYSDSYEDSLGEYELAQRRLDVGASLAEHAPRPVIVHTDAGSGDSSALSTLLMAQLLPQMQGESGARRSIRQAPTASPSASAPSREEAAQAATDAAWAFTERSTEG